VALHATRSPRRSRPLLLIVLLAVVAVLGTAWVRIGGDLDQARSAARDRLAAIQSAEHYALSLMAVDYRTVDDDVRRVLDASTGQAKDDYARGAERLKQATRLNKAVQTGVVRAAGLVSMNGPRSTARVLVVADSVIRWQGGKTAPQDRFYRWSVEVTKVRGAWWVSKLEQVA
jgi:Mce-associated membrane protein